MAATATCSGSLPASVAQPGRARNAAISARTCRAMFTLSKPKPARSDVEPEMHDVGLADDVFLALEAQLARLARTGFPLVRDVVVERDGFGADEAALEVGVDHARGLRRRRPGAHGPGAHFLRAGGEESQEAEQPVACADDA